ncbi:MAG: response regulator [Lysobacterales bacterium]
MSVGLEDWVAQLTLWSGAPDLTGRALLLRDLRPICEDAAAQQRPALRLLLVGIAKALAAASIDTDHDDLAECSLAALEWQGGGDPGELGLVAPTERVLAAVGMPANRIATLLHALRQEALGQQRAEAVQPDASTQVTAEVVPAQLANVDASAESPPPDPSERDTGAGPESTETQPRWISAEERDLIVETLYAELLPVLSEWSGRPSPKGLDASLEFLLESSSNALNVVGLPALAETLSASGAALADAPADSPLADQFAAWLMALAAWLEQPEEAPLADLANAPLIGVQAPPEWMLQARAVRIGVDPELLRQSAREVQEGDLDLSPADDVIPSVLQGMLRELPGNSDRLSAAVSDYLGSGQRTALDDARRVAHTLKGDANTVGIRGLANLTHALEDILVALDGGETAQAHGSTLSLLQEAADGVAEMADHVLGRSPAPAGTEDLLARVYAFANALDGIVNAESTATERASTPVPAPVAERPDEVASANAVAAEPEEQMSVGRGLLDQLLELSGESLALSNQTLLELDSIDELRERVKVELDALQRVAAALDEQVALRGSAIGMAQRERSDIDPLELDQYNELYVISRQLAETQADTRLRLGALEEALERLHRLSRGKSRLDRDLQASVQSARLVPVRDLRGRFERTVRQTARSLDKGVDLQVSGDALTVDKLLLDGLTEPLMHLLRNAVDHGLEAADLREAMGKPATGQIELSFALRGAMLHIELSDDGAGLDYDRIRQRGIELGLLQPTTPVDQATLHELLFLPGFSTRQEVSQVSGRGVGMDVVARRIRELGGVISIDSVPAAGTRFVIEVSTRLGTVQVALMPLERSLVAIACDSFSSFQPISADERRIDAEQGLQVRVGDQWQSALDVGQLLGRPQQIHLSDRRPLIALQLQLPGEGELAVLTERIESLVTVVLKPLGPLLPEVAGVRGATVLGDGRVAAVLDLREMVRARRAEGLPSWHALASEEIALPTVIVADDSLTVRRSLGELLEDAGYQPVLARDGLEALLEVEQRQPRALLVDLEMPRMNGLELARHLRQRPEYRDLPIIMITSRATERHSQLAEEAGVSHLLGKPYSEEALLTLLATALQQQTVAA